MKTNMLKLLGVAIISFTVLFQTVIAHAIEYSGAPNANYVIVANNVGKSDTLKFSGLYAGDVVKVYDLGGKLVGYGTVYAPSTEVTVTIAQLGTLGGSVFASVTAKGKQESDRTKIDFPAEPKSDAPGNNSITIINNVGISDSIKVTGLSAGDAVKVYDSAAGGKLLGSAAVPVAKAETTLYLKQLGSDTGSVYISVTSKGKLESDRTKADFSAEAKSDAPGADNITIVNNVGIADTVKVTSLSAGDIMRVYDSAAGGKLLGSVTVPTARTEVTLSLKQLGSDAGSVYISVANKGKLESDRTKADYSAEDRSDAPDAGNVFIVNNAGISDTVKVTNLSAGDVIRVYDSVAGGKLLGSATVPNLKTEATVNIAQLGTAGGSIYITVTSKAKLESNRVRANFPAESKTDAPDTDNITTVNNVGTADIVKAANLSEGDTVKVYDAATGGKLLGSATVPAARTEATVTISQLGSAAGNVYVAVTGKGMLESDRANVSFSAESRSDAVDADNIRIANNVGASDTVKVSSLSAGDIVKVYDSASGGKLLGSATVSGSDAGATVTIAQLGSAAGSVYVTVTGKGKLESDRVKAGYPAEPKTAAVDTDYIAIINNAGTADTVRMTDLSAGDTVRVYDSATGGKLLGSATVSGSMTEVTVSIAQLGTAAGSVYITVANKGSLESDRAKADYPAEQKSDTMSTENVTIVNNAGMSDTIKVIELAANDVIKVYDAIKSGNLLGSATVASNSSEATVTVTQLGTAAGSVYISVTNKGKQESDRFKADFSAEPKSNVLDVDNITMVNYAGISDTVKVTELTSNDVIKVYDAAKSGSPLGTATVPAYGTEATVTITQLGTGAGSIYVTVTNRGKLESDRVKADYAAEAKSDAPIAENISIVNNAGMADTVKVTNLTANDVIKVYDAARWGNLLGTATVPAYGTEAVVTAAQLGTEAGSVYVSITSKGKLESDRGKADFSAESKSNLSCIGSIIVTNNAGMPDTIKVTGITAGDAVKVYDAAKSGNLLGTATVPIYGTEATVTVTQLGSGAGSVYISITGLGKLESDRSKVDYIAEPKSDSPVADNVIITNNAAMSDVVKVTFLAADDLVKVYDSATGGTLLGSAAVPANKSEVAVNISQLGTGAGNVYISVTSKGKLESDRTKAYFSEEPKSDNPLLNNITIINNAGVADTIKVTFLTSDDLVKIYDSSVGGNVIGSATVPSGGTEATITVAQLGTGAGNVYISVTSKGKLESDRTRAFYAAEPISDAPVAGNITVVNNAGMSDIVKVTFLDTDDLIKVYDSAAGGKLLGSSVVSADSTEATVAIAQLGTSAGNVYVSIASKGKLESARTKAYYAEESKSDAPAAENITVTNNVGMADTVKVTGLAPSDVVAIYDSAENGKLLASAAVPADSSEVTVTIKQLGTTAGSVYVTVTGWSKLESGRVKADYIDELKTAAPDTNNIVVTNNAGASDKVKVSGLLAGDTVRVYDSASEGKLLGFATVSTDSTDVTITINQLGTSAGSVYITVTSTGKMESDRTKADFGDEVPINVMRGV